MCPSTFAGIPSDVAYRLNRHYSEYSQQGWSIAFTHSVEDYHGYLEIGMLLQDGSFAATHWKNRSRSRFERFVGSIGRLASQFAGKDSRIIVRDGRGRTLASYEFIRERNLLKPAILGFSRFDEAIKEKYPLTTGTLETVLDRWFDAYEEEDFLFLFDFRVSRKLDSLIVRVEAENFSAEDDVWKERDATAFDAFLDQIWRFVRDEMGEKPTVMVHGRNGALIGKVSDLF